MLKISEGKTLLYIEVTLSGGCGQMEELVLLFLWLIKISVCLATILVLPSNSKKDMKQTLSWMRQSVLNKGRHYRAQNISK